MIAVERLTKEFGRTRAVHDVSFRVERGQIVGLLGPNGSGKTTIMRTLTSFFPPTAGRVLVAGVDVTQDSLAAREKVGYLPESAVLYPDMRVQQFLDFCAGVRRLGRAARRTRIGAVVDACGLGSVRHRLIGQLSKGFRQRVGLAQALLHEPEVLILDEPTVGLDPAQIVEIRSLIRSLRGRTTVLLSTHILPEVAGVCERVVIIDRGRLVAEDTAEVLGRAAPGAERTLVRVDGPPATVQAALAIVPGVARVEPEPAAVPGAPAFIVHGTGGEAGRAALAAAVVGHGWGLIEIRPLTETLEDLFVRLVAARGGAEGG